MLKIMRRRSKGLKEKKGEGQRERERKKEKHHTCWLADRLSELSQKKTKRNSRRRTSSFWLAGLTCRYHGDNKPAEKKGKKEEERELAKRTAGGGKQVRKGGRKKLLLLLPLK